MKEKTSSSTAWTVADERAHLDRMLKNHGNPLSRGKINGITALRTWLATVETRRWHPNWLKNSEVGKAMLELVPTAKAYLSKLEAGK